MTATKNSLIVLSCTLFAISCKKTPSTSTVSVPPAGPDKVSPVITLKGDPEMSVVYDTSTPDPGATAIDDVDGDISSKITSDWSNKVNVNTTGTYNVTYSASDKSGNTSSVVRHVIVRHGAAYLYGIYSSHFDHPGGGGPPFDLIFENMSIPTVTISAGSNPFEIIIQPTLAKGGVLKGKILGTLGDSLTLFLTGSDAVVGVGTVNHISDNNNYIFLTYESYGGTLEQKLNQ